MFPRTQLYIMALILITVQSRTIRSKIFTNPNGTKELVLDPNSDLPQHEIDFLTKDLNNISVSTEKAKIKTVAVLPDKDVKSERKKKEEELNENILMKHWNSLTEVGWSNANFRRPVKRMYINNTRVLKMGPAMDQGQMVLKEEVATTTARTTTDVPNVTVSVTQDSVTNVTENPEVSAPGTTTEVDPPSVTEAELSTTTSSYKGRKIWDDEDLDAVEEEAERVEEEAEDVKGEAEGLKEEAEALKEEIDGVVEEIKEEMKEDDELQELKMEFPKTRKIWDIFNHLYQCVEFYSIQRGLLKCLAMRISSVFYPYMGKSAEDFEQLLDLSDFGNGQCSNSSSTADDTGNGTNGTDFLGAETNGTVTEGRRITERTLYAYKKLMNAILLPLLVAIVIKYLLALPFIVLGVLTTKTFWLSLVSAGVATFGDLFKKRNYIIYRPPNKKFGQVQGPSIEVNSVPSASNLYWSQLPVPWSPPKQDDRLVRMIPIEDKFYM